MKAITKKIWSHLSLSSQERSSIKDVRNSDALDVNTFTVLIKHLAHISYRNPQYSLFFRAQAKDYLTKDRRSTLYPSIYRKLPSSARYAQIRERFEILRKSEEALIREFQKQRFLGVSKLTKFREVRWALMQHYKVCKTPLLDVTHSLRVACSFALDTDADNPYVFVLGFPHINGSISYCVDEELLNVKLLSICPPRALRPYFQEGFLVGSFPSSEETRSNRLDVANRLIAKFRLNRDEFTDKNFAPLQHETLYPQKDVMEGVCKRVKSHAER